MAEAANAQSDADHLSKQRDKAKSRMPIAPRETIIKYINTSLDLLKKCIAEYRTMAETADGCVVNVGRLSKGGLSS